VVDLALVEVLDHGGLRGLLSDDGQKQCAPANHGLLFAKRSGEVELRNNQYVALGEGSRTGLHK
jgi:hypothetical protein